VFLDRDGTLSRNSPAAERERDRDIAAIAGLPSFALSDDVRMQVFWRVFELPGIRPVNTLEREDRFWRKWYELILESHGVKENLAALGRQLHERHCFHRMMELFPETVRVLDALRDGGHLLGVISDTFPSLEESLKDLGIAHYFRSFTASSLVGAGKPDPRIFRAATESLGVSPAESVFVDDCKDEADGARVQGFTSFHLDRRLEHPDFARWTLGNLSHLLMFLERR
jgi:putative hydrolase of the HAD superfamily